MSRLIVIIKKEFIHIIRDPRTLSLVIIMPVMMLFLLGYAVTGDIQDIPMAVADLSLTDTSRLFIQRFPNSGYFKINHYVYFKGI